MGIVGLLPMIRFIRMALLAVVPVFADIAVAEPFVAPADPVPSRAGKRMLFAPALEKSMEEVPIEYHPDTPRFLVRATIESLPVRLQVDSGARFSSVSDGIAERLKLDVRGTDEDIHSIATVSKRRVATIGSFVIGDAVSIPSGIISVEKITSGFHDGLFGADRLRMSHIVLDFDTHRMFLRTDVPGSDISAAAHAAGMEGFPLKAFKNLFVVDVNVNGNPARFIIDSGAETSILNATSVKRLRVPVWSGAMRYQGTAGSPVSAQVASLDELTVGGIRMRRIPMAVMNLPFPDGSGLDGILGTDFLLAARAALDAGEARLYLSPSATDVASFSRLGGELFDSDTELKHAWASADWIGSVQVRTADIADTNVVDRSGGKWRRIRVGLEIMKTFKGTAFPPGYIRSVIVLVPDSESWRLGEYVHSVLDVNRNRICFFDPRNTWESPVPLSEGLPTLEDLAADQIKRVVGYDTRAE